MAEHVDLNSDRVLKEFPALRDPRCPFDPPPAYRAADGAKSVSRVRIWDDSEPWFFTRYEDVRAVLGDTHLSSDATRPGYPNETPALAAHREHDKMLLTIDPPEHTVLRRLLAKDFMIKRVAHLRPRLERIIDELLDDILAKKPPVDLVSTFAMHVPVLVVSELFGVPVEDREHVLHLIDRINTVETTSDDARVANAALLGYLEHLTAAKNQKPGDDLISRILEERVATGTLSREELIVNLRLLVIAGFESTANQIALGTLLLLRHPEQLAALQADPTLVPNAVEEILRFSTIDHFGRRRIATIDMEIGGRLIRAGDGVVVSQSVANRDPEAFPDPDTFDIRREARHHLAFSYGPHQCLGQPLARLELEIAFGTLFRRIPNLRLAVPFENLRFKEDKTLYGVHALPVSWTSDQSSER